MQSFLNVHPARTKLAILALLALFSFGGLRVHADTVTLTLEGVGGQSSGPYYVYPYNFSVNGSADTISLMCISYTNEISFGESWIAAIEPVTASTQFEEAAYLFSLSSASGATANTIAEAQWANWELFDPNDTNLLNNMPSGYQGDVNSLLKQAGLYVHNNPDASLYSEYAIFMPEAGTQSENGLPQNLIGARPDLAPEPSSLILLGSGLMLLAVLLFRRKHLAGKSGPQGPATKHT